MKKGKKAKKHKLNKFNAHFLLVLCGCWNYIYDIWQSHKDSPTVLLNRNKCHFYMFNPVFNIYARSTQARTQTHIRMQTQAVKCNKSTPNGIKKKHINPQTHTDTHKHSYICDDDAPWKHLIKSMWCCCRTEKTTWKIWEYSNNGSYHTRIQTDTLNTQHHHHRCGECERVRYACTQIFHFEHTFYIFSSCCYFYIRIKYS